jgi:DNA-binding CsgD family transcriptional regulator
VRLAADPIRSPRQHAEGMEVVEELTAREREVATLLAYGHTNLEIARRLDLSIRTVEGERARLMRKLGLRRRSELVRWAIRHDLFGEPVAGIPQSSSESPTI